VRVEVDGPDEQRQPFDALFATIFGLANAERTSARGMPGLLQLALLAHELRDVIVFTRPPRPIQAPLFGTLGAIGRIRGLDGVYPEYLHVYGRTSPIQMCVHSLVSSHPQGRFEPLSKERPSTTSRLQTSAND
jgi:hypothetical protein